MKSKKIKIAPDKMQKLLQRIAEEEHKLDGKNLTDEELEIEEILVNQKIFEHLNHEKYERDDRTLDHSDSVQQESHWQKIQQKIEGTSVPHEPQRQAESNPGVKENHTNLLRHLTWPKTWKHQVATGLAAAVVLFAVLSQIPKSPLRPHFVPHVSDFLSKGKNGIVVQHIVCDYRVAWNSGNLKFKITDAELLEDQSTYGVPSLQPIQLMVKCLSHRAYAHLRFFDGDQTQAPVVINQKLEPNQWNLLPTEVQKVWNLSQKNGKVLVFITAKEIDQDTMIPDESVPELDQESVIAFFEVALQSLEAKEPL